jgi:hypothetical protein
VRRPAEEQHDHGQHHDAVDRQQSRAHRVDAMLMGGPGGDLGAGGRAGSDAEVQRAGQLPAVGEDHVIGDRHVDRPVRRSGGPVDRLA